jgi:hypothetical protein
MKQWDEVWLTLKETSDGEESTPNMTVSAGRPIGNKKAKAERLAASSSTRGINASIPLMVESMSTNSRETHKRSDRRWKSMMETQYEKLKLEKEMVQASKLEAQATMLKAMNESSNVALAKKKEKSKILMADMSTMDSLARTRYRLGYIESVGTASRRIASGRPHQHS